MNPDSLRKDSAYRVSYRTRDGLLRYVEGVYRGRESLYLHPTPDLKGLRFDSLRPGPPVAWTVPEELVDSIEEIAFA